MAKTYLIFQGQQGSELMSHVTKRKFIFYQVPLSGTSENPWGLLACSQLCTGLCPSPRSGMETGSALRSSLPSHNYILGFPFCFTPTTNASHPWVLQSGHRDQKAQVNKRELQCRKLFSQKRIGLPSPPPAPGCIYFYITWNNHFFVLFCFHWLITPFA